MAIGDASDIFSRLRNPPNLAPFWGEPSQTPVLNAFLQGFVAMGIDAYNLDQFVKAQGRLGTSEGGFVDLFSADYFADLPRLPNELDAAYKARIEANLFKEGVTRAALISIVAALTGRTPIAFEGWRDGGFCDHMYCDYSSMGGKKAYTGWLIVFRPQAVVPGSQFFCDYNFCDHMYAELGTPPNTLTDADIFATIQRVKMFGIVINVIFVD